MNNKDIDTRSEPAEVTDPMKSEDKGDERARLFKEMLESIKEAKAHATRYGYFFHPGELE